MFNTLRLVSGRRLRHVILPAGLMLPLTWVATAAQRVVPVHLPAEYAGVLIHRYDTRYDDSASSLGRCWIHIGTRCDGSIKLAG
jgi:hypothetical protein